MSPEFSDSIRQIDVVPVIRGEPIWSLLVTCFGPIKLPTHGQLQREWDHSPTRSPVRLGVILDIFLLSCDRIRHILLYVFLVRTWWDVHADSRTIYYREYFWSLKLWSYRKIEKLTGRLLFPLVSYCIYLNGFNLTLLTHFPLLRWPNLGTCALC